MKTRYHWLYIVRDYPDRNIHHFRNTRTADGAMRFEEELYRRFDHCMTDIGTYILEDGKARHIMGHDFLSEHHGLIPLPEPGMFMVNRSNAERQAVYNPTPDRIAALLNP